MLSMLLSIASLVRCFFDAWDWSAAVDIMVEIDLLEFLYLARQPTTQIRYGLAKTCSKPHHRLIVCVVT
jgi:hypothetical protein